MNRGGPVRDEEGDQFSAAGGGRLDGRHGSAGVQIRDGKFAGARLYQLAQALNVDVRYFFEGTDDPLEMTERQRQLLEFARNFVAMRSRRYQEETVALARALAEPDS
jgi:hypothetical protein